MQERGPAFGERLLALRTARGWSLREAAKFLGIAFTRIGEYERGVDSHSGKTLVPSYRLVRLMARVYAVPEEELLRLAGYGAGIELDEDERELVHGFRRLTKKNRQRLMASLRELDPDAAPPPPDEAGKESAAG